jgi:hypothetical protein
VNAWADFEADFLPAFFLVAGRFNPDFELFFLAAIQPHVHYDGSYHNNL